MAVLASLGANQRQITRVYFFETLSTIVSAGVLAFILSSVMTIMLGLQVQMFIDAIFYINLPWESILYCFLAGLLLSLLSTAIPVSHWQRKSQIASMIRGLD